MARQGKSWETLWRAAHNKSDLSNAVIKMLKTSNKSFRYDPMLIMPEYKTISKIREALNNPRTKAEAVFIALASRFESPANFNALLRKHRKDGKRLYVRMVHSRKFGNYFKLEYENYDGERRAYTPNKMVKDSMKKYRPPAPKNPALLESMRLSNVKAQNVNLWKGEVCKFLVSMTDLIATSIYIHDPKNLYKSDRYVSKEEVYDETPIDGTPNFDRYIKDLTHMRKQWDAFIPMATNLGLDVNHITNKMDELISETSAITEDHWDYDPDMVMYSTNELGVDVIESIHETASKIQNMALSDIDLTRIRKNAVIPVFKDYTPSKMSAHQTTVLGVTDRINDMVKKLSKHNFNFRD